MKFTAPAHVSAINLSCGPLAVTDGVLELPDGFEPSAGDLIGLASNGFAVAVEESEAAPAAIEPPAISAPKWIVTDPGPVAPEPAEPVEDHDA